MTRRRVDWADEEVALVQEEVIRLYLTDPELSVTALFEQAQRVLPLERRRGITAFSAARNILAGLKERCAELYAKGGGSRQESQGREEREELEKRVLALTQACEGYQAEIAALRARPVPTAEEVLASASTERLFFLTLSRFVGAVAGERAKMQAFIAEEVARYVSGERHAVEKRLFDLQTAVATIAPRGELPSAPQQPMGASQYMPNFLIAGLKRADFQRLQTSIIKANVRVANLDVSDPKKIAVPRHDRFFVFVKGLTKDLANSLPERSKNSIVVMGQINDLQSAILKEAERVRVEKATDGR